MGAYTRMDSPTIVARAVTWHSTQRMVYTAYVFQYNILFSPILTRHLKHTKDCAKDFGLSEYGGGDSDYGSIYDTDHLLPHPMSRLRRHSRPTLGLRIEKQILRLRSLASRYKLRADNLNTAIPLIPLRWYVVLALIAWRVR